MMKNTLSASPLLNPYANLESGQRRQMNVPKSTEEKRRKLGSCVRYCANAEERRRRHYDLTFLSDEDSIIRGRIYHININRVRHLVR